MPVVMSTQYLDRLCAAREYDGLTWISSALCGSRWFDAADANYGLPDLAFLLVERLAWFAQGIRSGAWTYYEATPPERREAMLSNLSQDASPAEFAAQYQFGMREWHTPSRLTMLDVWLDANDDLNNQLAWQIVAENRELLRDVVNTEP